jgi:hypothetical protein
MRKRLLIPIVSLLAFTGLSQSVEFTLGAGATLIDVETLVEKDEVRGTTATDWGVFSGGVSAQYFFASKGNIVLGAELMYQHLYWYQVRIPYGMQFINREYSVSAVRIAPILRFGGENNFVFDIGPELNFMDGVAIGLLLSANYFFPVSDKINIPVKLRMDVINGTVVTVPVTLHGGVRIKL